MRYTVQEASAEVIRRSEQIRLDRSRRVVRRLRAATGTLAVALALAIALVPGRGAVAPTGSVYGSFLLPQEAGGYVLAAVAAFMLGVAVTLACLHARGASLLERRHDEARSQEHVRERAAHGSPKNGVLLSDSLLGAAAGGVRQEPDSRMIRPEDALAQETDTSGFQ